MKRGEYLIRNKSRASRREDFTLIKYYHNIICVGLQHERCRSIKYLSNEYSYVNFNGVNLKL
jgi:hypothetical protein